VVTFGPPLSCLSDPLAQICEAQTVTCKRSSFFPWHKRDINHATAIFRQINKDAAAAHHDALEFPDGLVVLLTRLCEGQEATVLQLPAPAKTIAEAAKQRRTAYSG
jgi:hypothetical protein